MENNDAKATPEKTLDETGNPQRGELTITLAGKNYKSKLTMDGIATLENHLGTGIIGFSKDIGSATSRQIIAVLMVALRGGGNAVSEKEAKQIVWDAGLVETTAVVANILVSALVVETPDGDEGDEGNAEAAKQ